MIILQKGTAIISDDFWLHPTILFLAHGTVVFGMQCFNTFKELEYIFYSKLNTANTFPKIANVMFT